MGFKYAFSTLSCPAWNIEQVRDAAVRWGYDAVELRLLQGELIDPIVDRARVEDAARVLRAGEIEVCAFDTSCSFYNRSYPEEWQGQVDILRSWIELAEYLDIPVVRVFGGPRDSRMLASPDTSPSADPLVLAMQEIAPFAERSGVIVAIETHDSLSSAREVRRVLDSIASPHIAALWDSLHPQRAGEEPADVIDALDGFIALFHVKDARWTGSEWELVLLGEGDVPVREQLRLLRDHGYGGHISVEWEKKWHPEIAEPEVALPQHINWLRAVEGDMAT